MNCSPSGSSVHGILQANILAASAKSPQSCLTLRPHRRQPTRLPCAWDSPGKNTGVGCHFLLQCVKVKSESEVTQSCPTLHDPMDCSPPGSSIHGIFQARVLEWGAIAFLTLGSNLCLTHRGQVLYCLSYPSSNTFHFFLFLNTFPLYLNKSKLFPYLNRLCTKKCLILCLPPTTIILLVQLFILMAQLTP